MQTGERKSTEREREREDPNIFFIFPAMSLKMAALTCVQGNTTRLPRADEEAPDRQGTWWTTWGMTCGTLCLSVRKTLSKTPFQTSSSTCRSSQSDTKVSSEPLS